MPTHPEGERDASIELVLMLLALLIGRDARSRTESTLDLETSRHAVASPLKGGLEASPTLAEHVSIGRVRLARLTNENAAHPEG